MNNELQQQPAYRIAYLDFARGLAIFFMIMQHCILIHEKNAGETGTLPGLVFLLLGTAPAAPVFMVIMGIFTEKSRADAKTVFFRGIKLLFAAYLLNILRFILPLSIGAATAKVPFRTVLPSFFVADIFQLAGLSSILLALMKRIHHKSLVLSLLSVVILIVSPYLWGISSDSLSQPLWGTDKETVFFPFFPWSVYPLLGAALGDFFLSLTYKKHRSLSFCIAALCLTAGLLTLHLFPLGDGYSRTGASVHLMIIAFVFLWLPICSAITDRLKDGNKMLQLLTFWSRNVTCIYMVQWILFGWSILILGMNKQSDLTAVSTGLIVLVLTHFLTKCVRIRKLVGWI